jgi:hypothetical protein
MGDADPVRAIKDHWLATRRQPANLVKREQLSFWGVICVAVNGDESPLIDYLRSDRPLSPRDRNNLALYLSGYWSDFPGRGRPTKITHKTVAATALEFYEDWRRYNRDHRTRDRGQAEAMKDEALRFVVEDLWPSHLGTIDGTARAAIRDLMNRPKSRR